MQAYPHQYTVRAILGTDTDVTINSENLPSLQSAPPAQFDGPGDRWSPETLLVASIADCFLLTFKAIARASNFSWLSLSCDVEGTLDRVEGGTQFTHFTLNASLRIDGQNKLHLLNEKKADRLLHKAEENCLITNSLNASTHLNVTLDING